MSTVRGILVATRITRASSGPRHLQLSPGVQGRGLSWQEPAVDKHPHRKTMTKPTKQAAATSALTGEGDGRGSTSASASCGHTQCHASTNPSECQEPGATHSLHHSNSIPALPGKDPDKGEKSSPPTSHQPARNSVTRLCDQCGKCFPTRIRLNLHMRSHSTVKPYKCQACGKGFKRSCHLVEHERIHRGVKPHHCKECGKDFTCLSNLKRHLQTHSGQRPFECPECGKSFIQASNLSYHLKMHRDQWPHWCPKCNCRFRITAQLRDHLRMHGGDKPYLCAECGRTYFRASSFSTHMKTHDEERLQN